MTTRRRGSDLAIKLGKQASTATDAGAIAPDGSVASGGPHGSGISFRGARGVPIALVCPPPRGARKFRGPLISVLLATLMGPGVCHEHGIFFVALRANAGAYGDCWGCSRQGVVPSLKVRVHFRGCRCGCWSPAGPVGSVGVARLGSLSGFPAGGGLRGPHGVNGRPARGEPTAGFRGLFSRCCVFFVVAAAGVAGYPRVAARVAGGSGRRGLRR